MKLSSTVLFVKEIEPVSAFYTQNMDMEIELNLGSYVVFSGGLALWQPGKGHAITGNLETTGESNRFELYFEYEDIPALCKKLESAGVEFLHTVREEPWGQQTIRFFDPERNLIEAGEPPYAFVMRLYNSGMSIGQVAERTGMPQEAINQMIK